MFRCKNESTRIEWSRPVAQPDAVDTSLSTHHGVVDLVNMLVMSMMIMTMMTMMTMMTSGKALQWNFYDDEDIDDDDIIMC